MASLLHTRLASSLAAVLLTAAPLSAAVTPVMYFRMGEDDTTTAAGLPFSSTKNHLGTEGLFFSDTRAIYTVEVGGSASTRVGSRYAMALGADKPHYSRSIFTSATDDFGMECWVKPALAQTEGCLFYNGTPGSNGCGVFQSGSQYQARIGGTTFASAPAVTGVWAHVALVRAGGLATFYLDGVAVASSSIAVLPATGSLHAGGPTANSSQGFVGNLDELRTFTFAPGSFSVDDLLVRAPNLVVETPPGTSIPPGATADFGIVTPPATASLEVRIGNNGIAPLSGITAVIDGADATSFSLSGGPGSSLAAGEGNVLTIQFAPTSPGRKTARLRVVSSNDPDLTAYDVMLSGTTPGVEISVAEAAGFPLLTSTVAVWKPSTATALDPPTGLSGVRSLSLSPHGSAHLLALRRDGTVAAWGSNTNGKATPPAGLSGVKAVAAGLDHSVALKEDGTVVAWGSNASGQTSVPANLSGVVAIAAGHRHTLALRQDGTVVAWGLNTNGQSSVPAGLSGVTAVAAGETYSLALNTGGAIAGWGGGPAATPPAGNNAIALAAGHTHALALTASGNVAAWGIATGGLTDVPSPLPEVKELAANRVSSVALLANGNLFAWGSTSPTVNPAGRVPIGTPGLRKIQQGISAFAALCDSSLSFGNQAVPLPGAAKVLKVRSSGSQPLHLASVGISGPNAGDFAVTGPPLPLDLAPGAVAEFAVTFTPAAINTRQATLSIGSDDPTSPNFTLSLTGNGVTASPEITVFAGTNPGGSELLDNIDLHGFAETTVDAGGTTRSFTIRNAGTANLSEIKITEAGNHPDDFVISTPASSLAPGASSTFNVTFLPKAYGTRSVTLKILSNDGNEAPFEINLTGSALAPEITVDSPAGSALETGVPVVWGYATENGWITTPPGLRGVRQLASDNSYVIALLNDGTVTAWGDDHQPAMVVPEGLNGVTAVAAASFTGFALKEDGTVISWSSVSSDVEQVPPGLAHVRKIVAAGDHAMALREDGTVVPWGHLNNATTPMPTNLSGVVDIATSSQCAAILRGDGSVVVWGNNNSFQNAVPAGLSGVTKLAAGNDFIAALKQDGTVVAWGGSFPDQTDYPPPYGLTGVVDIAGNFSSIMARRADGSLVIWGDEGTDLNIPPAGLGGVASMVVLDQDHAVVSNPVEDFGPRPVSLVTPARTFTVRNTGSLPLNLASIALIGGNSADFQLNAQGAAGATVPAGGQTTFSVAFSPQALGKRSTLLRVTSNDHDERFFEIQLNGEGVPHVPILSIEESGQQLRDGTVLQVQTAPEPNLPTPLPDNLPELVSLSCGPDFTLGLKRDGTLAGWGPSYGGPHESPLGLANVTSISAGGSFAAALKSDGSIVVWRDGGEIIPLLPAVPGPFLQIAAGPDQLLALKPDGTVAFWSFSSTGGVPPPANLSGVIALAAGWDHALALKSDGTVVRWGSYEPVPAGLSGVVAIAAADTHSLALKSDGTVVGWGSGFVPSAAVPPAGLNGVAAISTSRTHSLALKSDGTVTGWGSNFFQQLNIPPSLRWVKGIAAGTNRSLLLMQAHSDFGTRPLAPGGGTKTFLIRNTGSQPLHISGVSVSGGNAADFTVNTSGMLATLPPGNSVTSFTVKFSPGTAGFRSTTLRVLSDDAAKPDFEIRLSGSGAVPASPLEAWRMTHFGISGNTGLAADDADPNHNGIPNLLEYALGGDPLGPATDRSILPYLDMPTAALVFNRDPSRNDLILTAQVSYTLSGAWTDLAISDRGAPFAAIPETGTVSELPSGPLRLVRVSDSSPTPRTRRFFRLKAVAAP